MDELRLPESHAVESALEVARTYCSEALLHHCLRSYHFAADLGRRAGLEFDAELLCVAALLHDLGLTEPFDSFRLPFEEAGAHAAWVFAAGSRWSDQRRRRLSEVIVRHMWPSVDASVDPEGHLLELATSLDIGGQGVDGWSEEFVGHVVRTFPRGRLADEFADLFESQAQRKPDCAAGAAVRGGIRGRLAENPLEAVGG